MSSKNSNLSDPRYGYDLVVAVTQASVNATMKEFLGGVESPEVTVCYLYNDETEKLEAIGYEELKAKAKGSDPFNIPTGAKPRENQDLINLEDAGYAGGFKAAIGLPEVPLTSIPAIVTLKKFGAPVLFNLFCREFQITGFEFLPHNKVKWVDQSQPTSGEPWYFSAQVDLNVEPTTTSDPAVTEAVKARAEELNGAGKRGQFSIQKLLMDLDTAFVQSVPKIKGIEPGWPVWIMISQIFLGAYLGELKKSGKPVFGFTFEMKSPDPGTVQIGALAYEVSALEDGNHQPIPDPTPEEEDAATLDYIGSVTTTRPTPVEFAWNWVELGEISALSGVQAIRRDHFVEFLGSKLSQVTPGLTFEPWQNFWHESEEIFLEFGVRRPWSSVAFTPVAIGKPDAEGFIEVLNLRYVHESNESSETTLHALEVQGTFSYFLNGSVAFKGNQVRLIFHPQVYMKFEHWEAIFSYEDLPGNYYYDKTRTILWQVEADQHGRLKVAPLSDATADISHAWEFEAKGFLGTFTKSLDAIGNGFDELKSYLAKSIDFGIEGYLGEVNRLLNSAEGWIFPGADTFLFHQPEFSESLDLVADVFYSSPEMNESVKAFSAAAVALTEADKSAEAGR